MDVDYSWYTDKLLRESELSQLTQLQTKIRFQQELLEQELDLATQLTKLETGGHKREIGEIFLNHDDEKRSLV